MNLPKAVRLAVVSMLLSGPAVLGQRGGGAPPLVRADATIRISDHAHVILDDNVGFVPNVGIIVGSTGTLIVDTGMGPRNGRTILAEARKLDADNALYVVSTHFHPEHALGEAGFPEDATIVRARAQQQDIDEFGLETAERFKTFSDINAELLDGVAFRDADRIFDRDLRLDLGGVSARVFWLGPTHTRGDTMVFVEGDDVLFAGDVVMNERFVSFNSTYSSLDAWIESLDALESMSPSQIVPSHGPMGDGSLIGVNRDYLTEVRSRVRELKAAGRSLEEVSAAVVSEIQSRYSGWRGSLQNAARVAYEEAD